MVLRARLYEHEMAERRKEREEAAGTKMEIGFGSQIRSYVLHPYQMIKDHRTNVEVGNVNKVLDGDLNEFIRTFLLSRKKE